MTRPSYLYIDKEALLHNVAQVRRYAPQQGIIAMVKANAYGCGLDVVVPILAPMVEAFGVACLEEAVALRHFCPEAECILIQGIFSPAEMSAVVDLNLTLVVHNPQQLAWVITMIPPTLPLKLWVKVDTGMHRLGFAPSELPGVLRTLTLCPWVDKNIGLMTHLACADTPEAPYNQQQLSCWQALTAQSATLMQSVANSAAIMAMPESHAAMVRPGLMLYGASPFESQLAADLGLKPVMHFVSAITTIHQYAAGEAIGYGATWRCDRPSVIGVIPVGYGDGYPRHLRDTSFVWVNERKAPIVGRISMDMMTINLTDCPDVRLGDQVELWGDHIPIEVVAKQADTIAYELMTGISQRVIRQLSVG